MPKYSTQWALIVANSTGFYGGRPCALRPDRLTSLIATVVRNEPFHWRTSTRRYLEAADRGARSDPGIQTICARTVRLIPDPLG
jgi:hypothetical protein